MSRINVTESYLPPYEEFQKYLNQIWKSHHLTNQGPLLTELEAKLEDYLAVSDLHFMTNGTIALQIALQVLGISEGEIITTPFSYVGTVSSILWQRCRPVFVDIEEDTFCIDADKIEAAITSDTKAIMAVHVFGYPCNVKKIEAIAKKHKLKVIYDAAHAFGAEYKGKSLLSYGDISMCSFHATKLFHTIEGGCLIAKDKLLSDKIELIKRFGHNGDEHYVLGINAKASEFQAAMGLSILPHVDEIIKARKKISEQYDKVLGDSVGRPKPPKDFVPNYIYYPVVFKTEKALLHALKQLNAADIFPRRYFYPSLNKLPYVDGTPCAVSEDISSRIACLPLYAGLDSRVAEKIARIINEI